EKRSQETKERSARQRGCQLISCLPRASPGRLTPSASPASPAMPACARSLPVAGAAWPDDAATRPLNDDGNDENSRTTAIANCARLKLQRATEQQLQPKNLRPMLFDVT